MSKTASNPLLDTFQTEHGVPPFHLINENHYEEAMKETIALSLGNIDGIVNNPEAPNFKNTIEALESATEDYERVSGVFGNIENVLSTDKMQELSDMFAVLQTEFGNAISFNQKLFDRIKIVFDNQAQEDLSSEQKTLLKKTYDGFVRNGALLSDEKKEELKKLLVEVSTLTTKFSNNMVNETKELFLVVESKDELKGIPDTTVANMKKAAEEKGLNDKFVVKISQDMYIPVITFAENRDLREKLWRLRSTMCQSGKNDNRDIIKTIITLRHKIALIMGYGNYAEFILKDRMAKKEEAVFDLIHTLQQGSLAKAKGEVAELKEFAKQIDGVEKLEPWDSAFYSEKLQKEKFGFDTNDLKPYYELNNVLEGVFKHFERIYGLSFEENNTYPKYHPDVKSFDLFDKKSGEFLGVFYADFFARDGKQQGAWANFYREGGIFEQERKCPVAAIVCNFEKSSKGPSLVTHDDVVTLYHEMGHAMHLMTYKGNYRSLSGFNVKWDFVELPSQLMEKWAEEKELIHSFAKHYETGELMPDDLIKGLKESSLFMNGSRWLRQATMSDLDMQYHTRNPETITDVVTFENEIFSAFSFLPRYDSCISTNFGHIFAGGYSAGYYSYAWADLLVADAYEYMVERQLYDVERGLKFRDLVLSIGAGMDEMDAYKAFRGQEPDKTALLRQEGLIVVNG